jgi:hypothetical protein
MHFLLRREMKIRGWSGGAVRARSPDGADARADF